MSSKKNEGGACDCPSNIGDWSFDEWKELHSSNPERFEECRKKVLHEVIDSASEGMKPRLQGLMFKMEGEARRSKSQMGYNIRLSQMLMEMLDDLRVHLVKLTTPTDLSGSEIGELEIAKADVLPFRPIERLENPYQ